MRLLLNACSAGSNMLTGNDIHGPMCFKARTGEGSGVEETGDLTTDISSNISTLSKASSNYSKVSEPGDHPSGVERERRERGIFQERVETWSSSVTFHMLI